MRDHWRGSRQGVLCDRHRDHTSKNLGRGNDLGSQVQPEMSERPKDSKLDPPALVSCTWAVRRVVPQALNSKLPSYSQFLRCQEGVSGWVQHLQDWQWPNLSRGSRFFHLLTLSPDDTSSPRTAQLSMFFFISFLSHQYINILPMHVKVGHPINKRSVGDRGGRNFWGLRSAA